MSLPFSTSSTQGLIIASILGLVFGVLLNKGRVTDYNVIVNLFRFKDLTVVKIMLTAIVVGGLGVFGMKEMGWIEGYHLKDANLLGVILGSGLFGVGMALYGYCPGTAVAAIATGRIHALVGFFGMLGGGIAYAFTYPWVKENILALGKLGKVSLSDVTGIPTGVWWLILPILVGGLFVAIERRAAKSESTS
ncbi:YeeE/YedE thiosulfate transporter family protein [Verrucomicrobiaceae bacterium 227]